MWIDWFIYWIYGLLVIEGIKLFFMLKVSFFRCVYNVFYDCVGYLIKRELLNGLYI